MQKAQKSKLSKKPPAKPKAPYVKFLSGSFGFMAIPKSYKKFNKLTVIIFIVVFAGIGSYLLFQSQAVTGPNYHVVATQGSTDPRNVYVTVTWTRTEPAATGYEVLRDGVVIGSTAVTGDAWDDLAYKDTGVLGSRSYSYQVRPQFGASRGNLSGNYSIFVRSNADIGSGQVFDVDTQAGTTDLTKAQAAVNAAIAKGGGIIQFSARTYTFSGTLQLPSTNNIILRGAGRNSTIIRPNFAGELSSCGTGGQLINFTGQQTALSTKLTVPVEVNSRIVKVSSISGLSVGQKIILFDIPAVADVRPVQSSSAGIAVDPGTGNDGRGRWDADEITAIDPANLTVTFKHPLSQQFSINTSWFWIQAGQGNGIEQLTLQSRSASETTFYTLLNLDVQSNFALSDVAAQWANRNFARIFRTYDTHMTGFLGTQGNPNRDWTSTCQYKITLARSANFTFISGEMGESTDDYNMSLLATQRAQRTLVRNSKFLGSRTYAFNEHGAGSRHWVFENNYVATGPNARYGAIFLGNEDFGFSGPGIIRNNTFENNYRDVNMIENSYEVRIVDNIMRNTINRVISGAGWQGSQTAPDLYGSIRWTISRNRISGGKGDGIVLGESNPNSDYPYLGIKDVIINNNAIDVTGSAINIIGPSSNSKRFQVSDNSGSLSYTKPAFVIGDLWRGNADGVNYGSPTEVQWSNGMLDWEINDNGPPPLLSEPDASPPSRPTTLTATPQSSVQVNLSWTASTDNVGVSGYDVYRNGNKVNTVATTSFSDTGLTANTTYSYYVIARDSAGNSSPQSAKVSATTLAPPPTNSDLTAPVVKITSPVQGSTVGRNVNVNATATDNVKVTKMEVYIDGRLKTSNTNSTSISYAWYTRKVAAGSHTITVKAYDAVGNIGQGSVMVNK